MENAVVFVRVKPEVREWLFEKAGPSKDTTVAAEIERLVLADKKKILDGREKRKSSKAV